MFLFVLDYGCDENNARKKRSAEDDLGKNNYSLVTKHNC